MIRRLLPLLAVAALAAFAQKYDGPRPPKPDLPYLKHADTLLPLESVEAKETKKKDDTRYTIDGASSAVRTPLASPLFLFQADKVSADALRLYKLETRSGHREISFAGKRGPRAYRIEVNRLTPDGIYRIEVGESLEPGEYSLSPEGSNLAFCFQVY